MRVTFNNVFAIFTRGGGLEVTYDVHGNVMQEHIEGEWVVHEDEQGQDWVLLFEDTDTAHKVLIDYINATKDEDVEVKRTLATSLADDQNIRLYRWDGTWEDIKRSDYMSRLAD